MSEPQDDALNAKRIESPCSADIIRLRFAEDEGYELLIEDDGVTCGWEGDGSDEGGPDPDALTTQLWRRRAPSSNSRDDSERDGVVRSRWIYVARRTGTFLDFRYEIRADEEGRLQWIDSATFYDLRSDPAVDTLDDSAYLERWKDVATEEGRGPDGVAFSPPAAVCNQSVRWHFYGSVLRLPKEAVMELMSDQRLFGPDDGFVYGPREVDEASELPSGHAIRVAEARVFDPLTEVRRCTESYFRRQDRHIEYLAPVPDSRRAELVLARRLTQRIANASLALVKESEDFTADEVIARAEAPWKEIKDLCFTPEEQEIVGPDPLNPINGARNFVLAEAEVRETLRFEASRTATALRIWLASPAWAFVCRWITRSAHRDKHAANCLSLALGEATRRLDELPTGARYTSWLANRATDPDSHGDPNVDLVRMFAFPEIDHVATLADFKNYARLPKAAFSIYLWANQWLLSRTANKIEGYLSLAFGGSPDVHNPTIKEALTNWVRSSDRAIFYRGMDRFEAGLQRIAGRPLLDCTAIPSRQEVVVYASTGDFGSPVALGTQLRATTPQTLEADLLAWEAEHTEWNARERGRFSSKAAKIRVAHVGMALALVDLFVNARETYLAVTDDDKSTYDVTKSTTLLMRSIFSVPNIGSTLDRLRLPTDPKLATKMVRAAKMARLSAADIRSVRNVFGAMAGKVGAEAIARVLSVVALGFAVRDAWVAGDEKTDEEYYAAIGAVLAAVFDSGSAILYALRLGRASWVLAIIAVSIALALLIYTHWLPTDAKIAVRTGLFGTEYQRRRAEDDYNHSARPWQACMNNSPIWFVPARRARPIEGLITQVQAFTNLMSNFTLALDPVEHDRNGLTLRLGPGFVPRDARFEIEVEIGWFLRTRDHNNLLANLDQWRARYRFAFYPEPWVMPVDRSRLQPWRRDAEDKGIKEPGLAEFRRTFHSVRHSDGGPLDVVRTDPNGCTLELLPRNGQWFELEDAHTVTVEKVWIRESYRATARVLGQGETRVLRIAVDVRESPGWSAIIDSAEIDYQVLMDGPVPLSTEAGPVTGLYETGAPTFEVPLPESQGELQPGSVRIRLRYGVGSPGGEITGEGEPAAPGTDHSAWILVDADRPLEITIPYTARVGGNGEDLVVDLRTLPGTCRDLESGERLSDIEIPIPRVNLQFIHHPGPPPTPDDEYPAGPGLPLERIGGDESFVWPPASFRPEKRAEPILIGDSIRFRFLFAIGRVETRDALSSTRDYGPIEVKHCHDLGLGDDQAARRWILRDAKVRVRLVSDQTDTLTAMPSNCRDDRRLWLEQDLYAPFDRNADDHGIVWDGNEPKHWLMPGKPVSAIDACLPPE